MIHRFLSIMLSIVAAVVVATAAQNMTATAALEAARKVEVIDGDLAAAIKQYQAIVERFRSDRAVSAQALLRMAECYEKLGRPGVERVYERILEEFGDQTQAVSLARKKLRIDGADVTRKAAVHIANDLGVYAVPSPDGRHLASSVSRRLVVRDVKTGKTTEVTKDCCVGPNVVFSADGRQLAYNQSTGRSTYSIKTIGIDGSQPRVLLEGTEFRNRVVRGWSRTGRTLVMFSNSGNGSGQIELLNLANRSVTPLKSTGWRYPEIGGFSPDDRYVIYSFMKTPTESGGIFAIAVDGSTEHALLESTGSSTDYSPVYHPDGTRLLFLSTRSGTLDLWSVGISQGRSTGTPQLLQAGMGPIASLNITRDGTLFYGSSTVQTDAAFVSVDPSTLKILEAPRQVSNERPGSNGGASWSTDGKRVAFTRRSTLEERSLIIRSTTTGEERTLFTENFPNSGVPQIQWLPDNRHLLIAQPTNGGLLFLKVDADTGSRATLFRAAGTVPITSWALSPDGEWLYYSARRQDPQELSLLRRRLATSEEFVLFETPSRGTTLFGLAVSPDGRQVASQYSAPDAAARIIAVVDIDSGHSSEIYRSGISQTSENVPQTWLGTAWSADGRSLVFIRPVDGRPRLWAIPAAGGSPTLLAGDWPADIPNLERVSFLPNGQGLGFTVTRTKSEMWAIRNLFSN